MHDLAEWFQQDFALWLKYIGYCLWYTKPGLLVLGFVLGSEAQFRYQHIKQRLKAWWHAKQAKQPSQSRTRLRQY